MVLLRSAWLALTLSATTSLAALAQEPSKDNPSPLERLRRLTQSAAGNSPRPTPPAPAASPDASAPEPKASATIPGSVAPAPAVPSSPGIVPPVAPAQAAGSEPAAIPLPAPAEPSPPKSPPAPAAGEPPKPVVAAPAKAAAPKPLAISQDPRPSFTPDTFVQTMRAAERYVAIAENGGWPQLPASPSLKLGDRGPSIAALKARLAGEGDLDPALLAGDQFDAAVLAAAKRFQSRYGLPETGLVGSMTIAAMNVPAEKRARQLTASTQRLAGTNFPFGERHVVVNIPAASVEAVENGQVARRFVAIVGKKERPSPTIMARISNVNFNPTWTVPVSLIRQDVIPQVRKDPNYLAKMRIRIFNAHGREVDPNLLDWSTDEAASYILRQDPGASNSLGRVRIDMPNKLAVYLHDTPSKGLFSRSDRFFSSGCVRVADIKSFVEWLLRDTGVAPAAPGAPPPTPVWTASAVEAAMASDERQDVKLAKQIPVAWVYLTGYAMADGTVHFRPDVYDLDGKTGPKEAPAADDLTTSAVPKPAPARRAAEPAPPAPESRHAVR